MAAIATAIAATAVSRNPNSTLHSAGNSALFGAEVTIVAYL
jgi:hypothetical protein